RVAERASAARTLGARHGHGLWRRAAVAVAVFLGLGGVASAWIGRSFLSERAAKPQVAAAPVAKVAAARGYRRERLDAPPAPSIPAAPPKKLLAARPVRTAPTAVPAPESAASLFALAARARHDGDLRRAVGLYTSLQTLFPASDQARV